MFVVIPYKTDAAVDYRPWATVCLMAANLVVACVFGFASLTLDDKGAIDALVLKYGTLTPWTWLTSAFVHAGPGHLVGNLIGLWTFGLVVEGAVGWRRFLPVYLGIVVGQCAVEQLLMLGADSGGSLGASAGVYGLMAISAVWAPRNHLTVFLWLITVIRNIEVTVLGFCGLWIGLDLLVLFVGGFEMGTELLHLMGAAIGVGVGIWMLRRGLVDCGGWDYFSLRAHGRPQRDPVSGTLRSHGATTAMAPSATPQLDARKLLAAGDATGADDAYSAARLRDSAWALPREDLYELIEALVARNQLERAGPRVEEFLDAYAEGSAGMHLLQVEIFLRTRRPSQALETLAQLPDGSLTVEQRARKAALEAEARTAKGRGGLELE